MRLQVSKPPVTCMMMIMQVTRMTRWPMSQAISKSHPIITPIIPTRRWDF